MLMVVVLRVMLGSPHVVWVVRCMVVVRMRVLLHVAVAVVVVVWMVGG